MGQKYDSVDEGFAAANVDTAQRHLFLCLGPDCADLRLGEQTWDCLKQQCRQLRLPVMRTKAGCFRVCVGGPWLLIIPKARGTVRSLLSASSASSTNTSSTIAPFLNGSSAPIRSAARRRSRKKILPLISSN